MLWFGYGCFQNVVGWLNVCLWGRVLESELKTTLPDVSRALNTKTIVKPAHYVTSHMVQKKKFNILGEILDCWGK